MTFVKSSTSSTQPFETPFEHLPTLLPTLASPSEPSSDAVQFDLHPASPKFLKAYSSCLALYITYLRLHPEWKKMPGRALLHAMESKPTTTKEQQTFSEFSNIADYVVQKISTMRFRETEYMMALGLLERFVENTKDEFEISPASAAMTILVSLITANKMSTDIPFANATYCYVLSISRTDVFTSEIYFQKSLHMNLSITQEQLSDLVKICECGMKTV